MSMQYSTTTVRFFLTRVRRRLLNIIEFYPISNYCEINEKATFSIHQLEITE